MSAVLHISCDTESFGASATNYIPCFTGRAHGETSEARIAMDVHSAGTASNLFVYISANDRAQSTLRQRVNAGNGNQLVTISASTTGQFEDSSNTDSFDATEEVCLQLVTGAGGTVFDKEGITQLFTPSSGTVCYHGGTVGFGFTGTSDNFGPFSAGSEGNTTENKYQNTIGIGGTLKNGFCTSNSNTRSDTVVCRTRINGVSGNTTLTFNAAATGDVEDTTNTDTVNDGDELNWMYDQNGGTGSFTVAAIKIEVDATSAFPIFGAQRPGSSDTAINSATTVYTFVAGSIRGNFDATEADKQVKSNLAFTWSDLYGFVQTYSLNSGNFVVRSRINGGNGNQVITFTGTGQQADTTNTDSVADDDEIDFSCVTGGTSGSVILTSVSSLGTVAAVGPISSDQNEGVNVADAIVPNLINMPKAFN